MSVRLTAAFIVGLFLALSAVPAVAGGVPRDLPPTGIISSVDTPGRTIVFRPDRVDKAITLPLDGSVDVSRIPVGLRVIVHISGQPMLKITLSSARWALLCSLFL